MKCVICDKELGKCGNRRKYCDECAKLVRRKRSRAYSLKYYAAHREEILRQKSVYYLAHREEVNLKKKVKYIKEWLNRETQHQTARH